jgi:hypothetical protein
MARFMLILGGATPRARNSCASRARAHEFLSLLAHTPRSQSGPVGAASRGALCKTRPVLGFIAALQNQTNLKLKVNGLDSLLCEMLPTGEAITREPEPITLPFLLLRMLTSFCGLSIAQVNSQ